MRTVSPEKSAPAVEVIHGAVLAPWLPSDSKGRFQKMAVDTAALTPNAIDFFVPDEERVPDEDRASGRSDDYHRLIHRLSHQSVVKHFDAYADIDWDSADFAIDPDDSRWELGDDDVLGATEWYKSRPQNIRSRIGLHMIATFMKIGVVFENVLKRGLLDFASRLPNGAPEFRYCYHEAIEEAQHSLMFQEFVNRTGFDIPGLGRLDRRGADMVVGLARKFPELFFIFVLAGEDPIDHVQRQDLRGDRSRIHPLLRRIMQIHVTEEARHLSFARHYLRHRVPELSRRRKARLAFRVPIILGAMGKLMMQASPQIVRAYHIPQRVVEKAYKKNPRHRQNMLDATAKLRRLCVELGLVNRWSILLWRAMGIWPQGEALATSF
jgi:P-aminobenzoate N-oxygenase AurF